MNWPAIHAIFRFEMARFWRTSLQSILAPVVSTVLYFVVFGAAIGDRIQTVDGIPYGAFLVPSLALLPLMTQSVANASFGIYFPRFLGTIYELLSAPVSPIDIVFGYIGAAAAKSLLIGLIILLTAALFVPLRIEHPVWMVILFLTTVVTFSLFGFVVGLWANSPEKLQLVPLLVVSPMTFLGGGFYSLDMLPPFWRAVSYLNPVVYLFSSFRWSFFGTADVSIGLSLAMAAMFLLVCLAAVMWIFKTGYRLKS